MVEGDTAVKRIAYESSHVFCQLPACAYGVPCAILEDAAQPVTVRFAEFQLGPGNMLWKSERPIDDVKCGPEVVVPVVAGTCQRLFLMVHELHLFCQAFVIAIGTATLEIQVEGSFCAQDARSLVPCRGKTPLSAERQSDSSNAR